MSTPRSAAAPAPVAGTACAVGAVASVQFGAALAVTAFPLVGPVGTVTLRFAGAALVMVLLTRPWRVRWSGHDVRTVIAFGLVFVTMNASLYLAISRLPLATAITIEFLGPLAIALCTSSSWRQRGWAVPAAAGVLLIGGALRPEDLLGTVAALAAAASWAAYILLSRRMGTSEHAVAGLALSTLLGAVVMLPVGATAAGVALLDPHALLLGLLIGVASSAIPYSLDLLALRRLSTAVFGVLTSLNPAVAALAGLLVLSQLPPTRQLAGVGLVVLAGAGVTLSARGPAATRGARPGASDAASLAPTASG